MNYCHANQWELPSGSPLHWHLGDPRRKPLSELIAPVWQCYSRPMLIAETSPVGEGRGQWPDDVAREVKVGRKRGMSVDGLCLYPIIDSHGWDDFSNWHNSGLWEFSARSSDGSGPSLERILCAPMPNNCGAGSATCRAFPTPLVRGRLQRKFTAFSA